jgi:hypothetical protein
MMKQEKILDLYSGKYCIPVHSLNYQSENPWSFQLTTVFSGNGKGLL